MYRNPVRREDPGRGSNRKKVVPESGTQGRSGKRQRSEEKCTGIRYAKRIREEVAIERKLYRNPVREGRLGKLRLEEERTEIRYVKEDQE